MEKTDKHYSFKEGMPTKPDVDLLLKTFPDIKAGDKFAYEAVGKLIGNDWNTSRFKSVTNSWRGRLSEKGVILECMPGDCFYAATADQVSSQTYSVLESIGRKSRKHRKKLVSVKTETDSQRELIVHQGRLMHELERYAKKHRMNVLPNTSVQQIAQHKADATTGE
jgi:hypothetical protein